VDWNQGAPGRALRHQGKSAGIGGLTQAIDL
jgi:hypothetical protein